MRKIFIFLAVLSAVSVCSATIITVDDDGPADFNNIQDAIDAANDGDIIIVADGIYTGAGNKNLDFGGRKITVQSANGPKFTIIDCQNDGRGFCFHSGEDANSVVSGFTIKRGYVSSFGGGIFCYSHSHPKITRCIISNNMAKGDSGMMGGTADGGGIYCDFDSYMIIEDCNVVNNTALGGIAWPSYEPEYNGCAYGGGICGTATIKNCIISGNTAEGGSSIGCVGGDGYGGGIYGSVQISNSTISNNHSIGGDSDIGSGYAYGGGIYNYFIDDLLIENCTIVSNTATGGYDIWGDRVASFGGGVNCQSSGATVKNSILWSNTANFGVSIYGNCAASYSDIEGGWAGEGNIDVDPLFADVDSSDFHLQSQAGRWDANSQSWVTDANTSPCIDAGDWASPVGLEPFPNGGRINMGAYGGTAEASKSYFGKEPCETIIAGDINGDCKVDFTDLAIMALHWQEEY